MIQPSPISAFGSVISTRSWSDANRQYRFGFNSQEKDNEIAGEGNSYTAEFWQYDTRLGRRFNLDPIVKHFESSYSCLENSPILFDDKLGNTSTPRHERRANRMALKLFKAGYNVFMIILPNGEIIISYSYSRDISFSHGDFDNGNWGFVYGARRPGSENIYFSRNVRDIVSDLLKGIDASIERYKGDARFKYGVVFKHKNGSNLDPSRATPDAKTVELDDNNMDDKDFYDAIDRFGTPTPDYVPEDFSDLNGRVKVIPEKIPEKDTTNRKIKQDRIKRNGEWVLRDSFENQPGYKYSKDTSDIK